MANVVSSVFYGISAELIAEWCAVSVETARRWKAGESHPSPTALKLFALYRERLVLGQEWHGWLINKGTIVDPEGNATTQAQLRAYFLIYQFCSELARRDDATLETFERLRAMAG